ncbi:tetratricopeptide repeat protein [Amycolatopsis acidicola]|uniref:Tetratricopeptide repeat protein n=1 Tax=Amycolatopsis acidicola TaxID=2596893 RepID=A0A5N0UQ79_9PSEU|nr:tetratricopeptide repeat protein [Amycolatopsis acidicola]KAA9153337.1 tetratricopeptide repeat protein [Amycolatopsis acidicola]
MKRVQALMDLRRWDEARAELASIIGGEPGNGQLWLVMSSLELLAGDPVRALEAADRAIGLGVVTAHSLLLRASALSAASRDAEALDATRQALALAPDNVDAHVRMARLLARRRNHSAEAEKHARRALELAPDNASAHLALGLAYVSAGGKASARRAREPLAVAASLAPDDPDVLSTMASVDLRLGKAGRAVRRFASVLRNVPGHATSLYNLPIAVWAYLVRSRFVVLGLGLAALLGSAFGAVAEGSAAVVVTHVVATAVLAGLAWLLLIRRTVRIFPPGMRTAAVTVLGRDRLSRPIVLGVAWAVCCWLALTAVPWPRLAFYLLVAGNLGYALGLLVARRRLAALSRHADEVRRAAWAVVVTGKNPG